MLDCGDVLLCHDYFALASACYSQGLGSRERAPGVQRQSLEGSGCWEDAERVCLLKVLYCAASIADRGAYIHTALSLHALRSKRESRLAVSSESHTSLSADPDDFKEDGRTLEAEGVYPLLHYFEVNGDGSAKVAEMRPEMLTEETADLSLSSTPSDVESLRPDARCTLHISITSLFPCIVEVDEVSVMYESHATDADAALPSRHFTAITAPAQEVNSITLQPAVLKVLSLSFVAPSSTADDYGDFYASEVRVLVRDSIGGDDMVRFQLRRRKHGDDTFLDADDPPPAPSATDDTIGSESRSLCRLPVINVASPHPGPGIRLGRADSVRDTHPHETAQAAEICVCASLPTPPIQLPTVSTSPGLLSSKGSIRFVLQVELKNASASQRRMLGFRIRDSLYNISDLIHSDSNKNHASNVRDTFPAITGAESGFEVSLIDSFCPAGVDSTVMKAVAADEVSSRGKPALLGLSGHPVVLLPGDCCCVTLALSMVSNTPSSPARRGTACESELGLNSASQPSLVFSFDGGGEGQGSSPRKRESTSVSGVHRDLIVSLSASCQWMTRRLSLSGCGPVNSARWTESLLASSTHTPAIETAASSSTYDRHTIRNRSGEEGGVESRVSKGRDGEGSSRQHTGEVPHRRSRSVHNRDLMQRVLTKAIKVERPLTVPP
jgi:hypothetical protein